MRSSEPSLRERLDRATVVFGREREIEAITRQLAKGGAAVVFVHGLGGIGKSSLVAAIEPRLRQAGAQVLRIDGRTGIEVTPDGFMAAIGEALIANGAQVPARTPRAIAAALEADPRPTVVIVDEYDRLRLLDQWIRQIFLPAQPERARWVFVGQLRPNTAWFTTPGWSDAVLPIELGLLDEAASIELLARRGVPTESMSQIWRIARGHPLALELSSRQRAFLSASVEGVDKELAALDLSGVLAALAARFVDALGPELCQAVEALAVARRATRRLLEAVLAHPVPDAFIDELAQLTFVARTAEGLMLHDCVRTALIARLSAIDPERHRALRAAIITFLDHAIAHTPPVGPEAWRLTADLLFVVQHPEIREAFYPSEEGLAVDGARPEDGEAVHAIIARRSSPAVAAALGAWWEHGRSFFDLVRDDRGRVLGLAIVAPSSAVSEGILSADPLVGTWLVDLTAGEGRTRGALFVRAVLIDEHHAAASDVRGALWLAAKRAYVARPSQWALYTATTELSPTLRMIEKFGFRDANLRVGGEATLRLEFGASGLWSWLRSLLREELLRAPDERPASRGWCLVEATRGLSIDGRAVALSPLEYRLLNELLAANGAVVARDTLLERVWKQRHTGSNVVDALVRLVRQKLGPYASSIETVKGHGFRLRS